MAVKHPWRWMPEHVQGPAFVVSLVFTLGIMAALQILGAPLKTGVAPAGIITFELVGDLAGAVEILDSWGDSGRVYAGLNLGLDFLFLFAYAASIGLGCVLVSRKLGQASRFLEVAGVTLAWGLILAALLDAVENYALIRLLLGARDPLLPVVARWSAIPKFAIVAAGIVYVILGVAGAAIAQRRR